MASAATNQNLDLFSDSNIAAVSSINALMSAGEPGFIRSTDAAELADDTDTVTSIFHFAGEPKGINDYPESYESLRVRCSKKAADAILAVDLDDEFDDEAEAA